MALARSSFLQLLCGDLPRHHQLQKFHFFFEQRVGSGRSHRGGAFAFLRHGRRRKTRRFVASGRRKPNSSKKGNRNTQGKHSQVNHLNVMRFWLPFDKGDRSAWYP